MLVGWKDGFRSTMMSKMKDGARGGEVESRRDARGPVQGAINDGA